MRRSWTILLVVAMAFTTALSAGAGKPCNSDPTHPSCKDAPAPEPDLWTCDARRENGAAWKDGTWDDIRSYVSNEVVAIPLCIDVAEHKDVELWTVEWEGEARKPPKGLMFVFEEEVPGSHYAEIEVKPTAVITSGSVEMTLDFSLDDDGEVRHLAFLAMGQSGDKWKRLKVTVTPTIVTPTSAGS